MNCKVFLPFFLFLISPLIAEPIFTDSKQALMWQDDANVLVQKRSWNDALHYCKNLKLYNKDNWRLPTTEELRYAQKHHNFAHKSSQSFWTNAQFVFLPFDPWKAQGAQENDLCCSDAKVYTRCVREN